jgi:hypothetical protein
MDVDWEEQDMEISVRGVLQSSLQERYEEKTPRKRSSLSTKRILPCYRSARYQICPLKSSG